MPGWVNPPIYLTSRLYPLFQTDKMQSAVAPLAAGSWFLTATSEAMASSISFLAGGFFGLALHTYANWPVVPDQMKSSVTLQSGSTLDLGLLSYANWPVVPDQMKSSVTLQSGSTLDLGLLSYVNWPVVPDQIKNSMTIQSGTLT